MSQNGKTGFEIPIFEWLKGDLSYLLDDYLNERSLNESGFFNVIYVNQLKQDFLSNKLKDPSIVWKILQFQMWYKKWIN